MNERQLRYACGVWRERSFSRAAERLHVSQPSLSDQVRLLEEEIGFPIFYRGARGIEPSVNGQTFLERAEQVLESLARLELLGRRLRGSEQESIRVGFNTGIASHSLSRLTALTSAQPAKIRLEVTTSTNRRIQRLVHQDKLDIGFLLNADMEAWSQKLTVVAESRSEMELIVPPGHSLADAAPSLQDIALYPLIVSETELGSGRAVLRIFRKAGLEPNIVADCDNVQSVKDMVLAGLGLALLPRICVEQDVADGRLCAVALRESAAISVQLIRGTRTLPGSLESFLVDVAARPF